ncbi:unnamed protein product [Knipowitschia caucasica]|uniref:BZIP domain-containing protein n=1 Tax=Knipowitschia caucasica TaxID=637954 RepID=A0AAV2KW77_KNICA
MDPTPHEGDGVELLDWLFEMMENDGTFRHVETGHNGNHNSWPMSDTSMLESPGQGDGDFLTALLSGSDSAPSSPLWSPSHSDSGISEDPHSDQMDSPLRPESPPSGETPFNSWGIHTKTELEAATANINISNSWDQSFQNSHPQTTPYPGCGGLSSGSALTVKDLLLAGTADSPSLPSQQSIQELVLNEDERKLLAKEGVTLPSQLPLTKYEERILKKVRRKIRNKQSAQESRKKKKEYIDGLESRMAACNAHNQELQRKVSQLEKCNMSLMQQLRRLQALVMNTSNRPAQTGTCVLVFLLSFSLILFPSLKPFSSTDVNQGDFSSVRVQSRSLQNLQASRVLHAINPQYTTEDEAQDDLPHRRFPGDEAIDHVNFLMKNLNMQNFEHDPESFSPNGTEEENVAHFHVDPITGHIATVTLDPQRPARLRPHADDM